MIPPLVAGSRQPLDRLLTDAGFRPVDATGGAVWQADPQLGEVIEFLIPHQGTAKQVGRVRTVAGQPGIGGISLPQVDLLARYRAELKVPIAGGHAAREELRILVPTLGAYLVGKAATFLKRRHTPETVKTPAGADEKRAKDLLYIRDLMAAGGEVGSRIESDLAEVRRTSKGRNWVSYAETQLQLLLDGRDNTALNQAAVMLAERESLSLDAASADLKGHLTDALYALRPPKQRRR